MNRVRRKEIEGVIASLESLQMEIERQAEIIGSIGTDEEDYRDNIPENLEGSARWQAADDAANAIESARTDLETISFDDAIELLREAMA